MLLKRNVWSPRTCCMTGINLSFHCIKVFKYLKNKLWWIADTFVCVWEIRGFAVRRQNLMRYLTPLRTDIKLSFSINQHILFYILSVFICIRRMQTEIHSYYWFYSGQLLFYNYKNNFIICNYFVPSAIYKHILVCYCLAWHCT